MKNFYLLFLACVAMVFIVVFGIGIATTYNSLKDHDRVSSSTLSQTLKTLEQNSNGKTSCDVKWEDKKMIIIFHFDDITNSFFRD
ncbi:MAG: hypothetical protein M0P12_00090 [Paludibacteraceae bacterium]|nr:hypothetical protein [Paludibacteraceae bacterium]MCK9615752.1 hypothetical protein [Candidatus Omnitrophota bacterium]